MSALYFPTCDCGTLEALATWQGHDYCQACLLGELENQIACEKDQPKRFRLQATHFQVLHVWKKFQAKHAANRVVVFETPDDEPDPSTPASMPILQLPPVCGLTILPNDFERRAVKVIFTQVEREKQKAVKCRHDFWNDPITQVRRRQWRANLRSKQAPEGLAPIMLFEKSPQVRRDGVA
jgi:hypothetical protein